MSVRPDVAGRLERVRDRIERAARLARRDPAEITLIGVSKTHPAESLRQAVAAGLTTFGENRVQEAQAKAKELPASLDWHLIGPLQSNKARVAAGLFRVIHSVDRLKIAQVLDVEAARLSRRLPCFLEINLGAEESKHGFLPGELSAALDALASLAHLEILGLMAIPPFGEDPEASRPWFHQLARLRDQIGAQASLPSFQGALSMGMSHDFEVAIAEGATHVRVGTAIFGEREHTD